MFGRKFDFSLLQELPKSSSDVKKSNVQSPESPALNIRKSRKVEQTLLRNKKAVNVQYRLGFTEISTLTVHLSKTTGYETKILCQLFLLKTCHYIPEFQIIPFTVTLSRRQEHENRLSLFFCPTRGALKMGGKQTILKNMQFHFLKVRA